MGEIGPRDARGKASVVRTGLPPSKVEELFRPFGHCGTGEPGLGLGLAISRKSVGANGGEIHVANLPGKGCIFPRARRSRRWAATHSRPGCGPTDQRSRAALSESGVSKRSLSKRSLC
jgi:hypothetical protein